ncbi:MAG: ATP synthase F0 subunit B [Planctomycetaceae bacterium]|nr:ATP synthase F0 subunit B [Planctomycetaceae bacterium]
MTGFHVRSICLSLFAAMFLLAARSGLAQEHPEPAHPPAAAAEPAEAHHEAHGAVDYNKPPLPGFAPGLMTLFVYSLVLFTIFLVVARSMVWKPLISALDEREGRILAAQVEAEHAKTEAARLLAAHDAKMAEVQEQVKGIVAQARQAADAEKAQIIASAEAEAKALRDRAVAEIRQARDEAMSGLLATVDRQVGLATEHVLGHRLN